MERRGVCIGDDSALPEGVMLFKTGLRRPMTGVLKKGDVLHLLLSGWGIPSLLFAMQGLNVLFVETL